MAKSEPSHWTLNTESVEIPNSTKSFSFGIVNGDSYRILVTSSWGQRVIETINEWIDQPLLHQLADLLRDLAVLVVGPVYALLFISYWLRHKLEPKQVFNFREVGRLVLKDLLQILESVFSFARPVPQYEVTLTRLDGSGKKSLPIPADWGGRIFIISDGNGARVERYPFFKRPRGKHLRVMISQNRLELVREDDEANQWWAVQRTATGGPFVAQPISSSGLRWPVIDIIMGRGWIKVWSGQREQPDNRFIYKIEIPKIVRKVKSVVFTPAPTSSAPSPP